METIPVFVGLDYHPGSVQVAVLDAAGRVLGNRSCPNDPAAIQRVAESYGVVRRAAIEACTGAADLAERLVDAGWHLELGHTTYVARMKRSPDKSDWADSRLLADLTRVGYLPKVWLPPAPLRELRRLVRYRQQLADQRRDHRLRIRALLREHRIASPEGSAWTRRWLAWLAALDLPEQTRWIIDEHLSALEYLARRIRVTERRLHQVTAGDAVVEKLLTQPGIGPVTAWTIAAEVGRFDRFTTGKQLAHFCGLSPRNVSSGEKQADGGLIATGQPRLRATLIELGHRLIRTQPRWRDLAQSWRERGKPTCVIVAGIANRYVRWLYHQMLEPTVATTAAA